MIRDAVVEDAGVLAQIYNHYVTETVITFEEEPVTPELLWTRVSAVQRKGLPWLVLEHASEIVGYAYAAPWKERSAYRFSVESSVYLSPKRTGGGFGKELYQALFTRLREGETHVIIAGIALPNPASVALHERFGFRASGVFRQVGFKFDRWVDVGYWELVLDQCELEK
ncbi:MAG: N-acetyltransferase family protein [Polyangiaceae bacterium]